MHGVAQGTATGRENFGIGSERRAMHGHLFPGTSVHPSLESPHKTSLRPFGRKSQNQKEIVLAAVWDLTRPDLLICAGAESGAVRDS